jgi:hypothetical protein
MLRKQIQPEIAPMTKTLRDEIPMETLRDVRNWHQVQVQRFERLAATRNPKGFTSERNRLKADLSQLRFHQRIVAVLETELTKKIRTPYEQHD